MRDLSSSLKPHLELLLCSSLREQVQWLQAPSLQVQQAQVMWSLHSLSEELLPRSLEAEPHLQMRLQLGCLKLSRQPLEPLLPQLALLLWLWHLQGQMPSMLLAPLPQQLEGEPQPPEARRSCPTLVSFPSLASSEGWPL